MRLFMFNTQTNSFLLRKVFFYHRVAINVSQIILKLNFLSKDVLTLRCYHKVCCTVHQFLKL